MSQPIEIQGIKFFDNASACISYFQETYWLTKAVSIIQSFGTFLAYIFYKIGLAWRQVDAEMEQFTKINDPTKQRLVVCIHGLNSKPSQFEKIVHEMQEKDLSGTEIFVPHVLEKGNATLDEMVNPIFEKITEWAETAGDKELVLVGISNGGRISRAIEVKIATLENTNIKTLRFISIVGACKGSSLVNFAKKIWLSWVMSKNISEEMAPDSKRIQRLNQEWEEGLSKGPIRDYTFIASPHDWQVIDYDSTLMETKGKTARYAIVPGHGHNSIVNAVAKSVAEIIIKR